MSLAIVTTTNEGNILAADSMETYRNSLGDTREGSQTRMKLFQLNERVGAVACGLSFLENKNIHQHVLLFKRLNQLQNLPVAEIAGRMYDYFSEKYSKYLQQSGERRVTEYEGRNFKEVKTAMELECITVSYKDPEGKKGEQKFYQPIIEFLIAGHDPDGTNQVYKLTIPDPKEKNGVVLKLSKDQCGATWIGQTDVLVRIIRGWSPEIKRLKAVMEIPDKKREELLRAIDDQEYLINWATMTFQDAIEFSNLAIKTTESIQKITDGTWQYPGSSPGVGGEVDVAVTTPDKGFVWLQKKKIGVGATAIDLDSLQDLNEPQF
ncbi:MAG TPA: hypothetical protein VI588_01295 [Candidatus Gracilibacteria bacterium]|nr:hypothetical protein [Candidatus Gracilibacteria bacterium]